MNYQENSIEEKENSIFSPVVNVSSVLHSMGPLNINAILSPALTLFFLSPSNLSLIFDLNSINVT